MLINIGFGNVVNMDKVISIVRADAAPVKGWFRLPGMEEWQ